MFLGPVHSKLSAGLFELLIYKTLNFVMYIVCAAESGVFGAFRFPGDVRLNFRRLRTSQKEVYSSTP